ncbi:MAG: hypothetical protein OXC46_09880 [Thaumarchaeota archaeon]|nr:hypothetical protein [Nitrososphaerota archaeon]
MKKYSEIKTGDVFFSTCSISEKELDSYLDFSRVKNSFLEARSKNSQKIVSGRAILSRMEGEFTRLSQIYGNHIVLTGMDGDPQWGNRNTRFPKSLHVNEVLKIQFTISAKKDIDDDYGSIAVDYEGTTLDGSTVVVSKRNMYRIKKILPT